MKVREIIRLIKQDGWYSIRSSGGHRQFKHATKPGRVTVSGKMSHDIAPGTLKSILRQAGLES
jgi:predicted RNA binding protein YcfA (HicA-like mRNA interferase family)